ncbi:hypothetical protein Hanom_Chr05g00448911 [Helianthus anomalus]
MATVLSCARDPTPPHDPEPAPELDSVPFWVSLMLRLLILSQYLILTMFLLVNQTLHPLYLIQFLHLLILLLLRHLFLHLYPLMLLLFPLWRPTFIAPTCLSFFFQDIPAPREGTSGQHPNDAPFATAAFPPTLQAAPLAPFSYSLLDEPFQWSHRHKNPPPSKTLMFTKYLEVVS